MISFNLPILDIILCLFIGLVLASIYLFMLWHSIKNIAKRKHKGLFLFVTIILRLAFLVIFVFLFGQQNPARVLYIFIGFIITRLFIVSLVGSRRNK